MATLCTKGGEEQIPRPFHYDNKMATPRFRQKGRLGLAVKRALASKDVKYICRSSIKKGGNYIRLHIYMAKHDIRYFNKNCKAHDTVSLNKI